jgi:Ca2+-binding RTX toxin-like protein
LTATNRPAGSEAIDANGKTEVVVPGNDFILTAEYARAGTDLVLTGADGREVVVRGYFEQVTPPTLATGEGAAIAGATVMRLAGPEAPGQYAQAAPAPGGAAPIGRVETADGQATAQHTDGTRTVLAKDSPVFAGDVVQTGAGARLGIVFVDKTTFALGESARMVLDSMIYNPDTHAGSTTFSLLQGAFVFVTGEIGKANPQAVQVNTPVATIGIRGTHVAANIVDIVGAQSLIAVILGAIAVINNVQTAVLDQTWQGITAVGLNAALGAAFIVPVLDQGAIFGSPLAVSNALQQFQIQQVPTDVEPGAGPPTPGDIVQHAAAFLGGLGNLLPQLFTPLPPVFLAALTEAGEAEEEEAGGGGERVDHDLVIVPPEEPGGLTVIIGTPGPDEIIPPGPGPVRVIGDDGDDLIRGTVADGDELFGQGGNDILEGGPGGDLIDGGDSDADIASYANADGPVIADLANPENNTGDAAGDVYVSIEGLLGSPFDDMLFGDAGNNIFMWTPGGGSDTVDGRAGMNTVLAIGGNGDDEFSLSAEDGNVILRYGGDIAITATNVHVIDVRGGNGNDMFVVGPIAALLNANTVMLDGGDGDDTLNGLATDDNLIALGGDGNDTLIGGSAEDFFSGGDGDDTLTGNGGTDLLFGDAGNDTLDGGDGDDVLDGGADADDMAGGADNDTYFVDNAGDVVTENADEGMDSVVSSIDYALGPNVENLVLAEGAGNLNGTGNELANTITGNSGDNRIDGGANADLMIGGDGNDTYVVDDEGDTIVEVANQGIDTVLASASHTLEANVENMTMSAAGNLTGIGNDLANVISVERIGTLSAGSDTIIDPAFALTQLARIDDSPSAQVAIGFGTPINFFGTNYDSLFVNNNGNVTFDAAQATFTPFGLGAAHRGTPIIAPFFADVDTRGAASGVVEYGTGVFEGKAVFVATWPLVGYYNQQTDKLNEFQIVLVDQGAGDFDIYFNYGQIQWETGDASGGVNGLGGFSASVGFSEGTGEAGMFFQLDGSLVPGSFLDNGTLPLVDGTNIGVPGRFVFLMRDGQFSTPEIGDKMLSGLGGDDTLIGGDGNDTLIGGADDDTIDAGSGNDTIVWNNGDGSDVVDGGIGFDTLVINGGGAGGAFDITGNEDGHVIVTRNGVQIVDAVNIEEVKVVGGDNADTMVIHNLAGTDIAGDTIIFQGLGGDDQLDASDSIHPVFAFGGDGNDSLTGGGANDFFEGGADDDAIDGGAGVNRVSYFGSPDAVDMDLQLDADGDGPFTGSAANDGWGGNDLLANIRDIEGSNFVGQNFFGTGDALRGDAQDNTIWGFDGNDLLAGRAGNDKLIGGDGLDMASYLLRGAPISVDFSGNQNIVQELNGDGTVVQSTDELTSVERVIGTSFDDIFVGGATVDGEQGARHYFRGGPGDDQITAGNQTVIDYSDATDEGIVVDLQPDESGASVVVQGGASVGEDTIFQPYDAQSGLTTYIYGVWGTDFADNITGNAGGNRLRGNAGDDTIDGGDGFDIADYHNSPDGVVASLDEGEAQDGHGDTDTLFNIEGLFGSTHDDTLAGNDQANLLIGNLGSDSLSGGTGADVFGYLVSADGTLVATNVVRGLLVGDTLTDFDSGADAIQLSAGGFGFAEAGFAEGVNFSVIEDAFDGTNPGDNANHAEGQATLVYSTEDRTLYYDGNGADPGYTVLATVGPAGEQVQVGDLQLAA